MGPERGQCTTPSCPQSSLSTLPPGGCGQSSDVPGTPAGLCPEETRQGTGGDGSHSYLRGPRDMTDAEPSGVRGHDPDVDLLKPREVALGAFKTLVRPRQARWPRPGLPRGTGLGSPRPRVVSAPAAPRPAPRISGRGAAARWDSSVSRRSV